MIYIKWLTDCWGTGHFPNLITTLINMFLKPTGSGTNKANYLWGEGPTYTQTTIQQIFVLIAVVSVPIMLIPYPIIQYKSQFRNKMQSEESIKKIAHYSEFIIHSVIETIEFVLGCVSNTAS